MIKNNQTVTFLLLIIAQILLCNFFTFSQYLMLTFLPAMILFLPIKQNTNTALFIAFAAGFAVDFLSDGMLGLSSLSLVPVAFFRKYIIRLVFGSEVLARGEDLSIQKNGIPHILTGVIISTAIFLAIYIWADGAGMRPALFNLIKFAASLTLSSLISVFITRTMTQDDR